MVRVCILSKYTKDVNHKTIETFMKDTTDKTITEEEFMKDIGHGVVNPLELAKNKSNGLELEEMFEEYGRLRTTAPIQSDGITSRVVVTKQMQELITLVTKQIQSDLLKEVLSIPTLTEDIYKGDIKKLAEERGIDL